MSKFFKNYLIFLRTRKRYWLLPLVIFYSLLFLCIGAYSYGQERIGYWSNVERGNNYWVYQNARSFSVYKIDDEIINVSGVDTIRYKIAGALNYQGKVIGGNWVDEFDVADVDSFIYEINSNFDIEAVNQAIELNVSANRVDTIKKHFKFLKNGKVKVKLIDVKGFDDLGNEVKVKDIKKSGKKIIHKFEKKVKKVDPTWTWQPDATAGKDSWVQSAVAETNYGTNPAFQAGEETGVANVLRGFIQFTTWKDSVAGAFSIDSAFIYIYEAGVVGTPSLRFERVTQYWDESVINYNNQPATSTPYSDTLTAKNDGNWWKYNLTTLFKAYWADTYADSGQCLDRSNDSDVDEYLVSYSSDHPTPAERPKLRLVYSSAAPSGGDLRGIISLYDNKRILLADGKITSIYDP